MHPFALLAYAAFGVTTLAVLLTVNGLSELLSRDIGRRTRIRRLRKMGVVIGTWEISVGLCILATPGSGAAVASAIGPIAMGCMFLSGSWLSRKFGVAPWWAPE